MAFLDQSVIKQAFSRNWEDLAHYEHERLRQMANYGYQQRAVLATATSTATTGTSVTARLITEDEYPISERRHSSSFRNELQSDVDEWLKDLNK